LTYEVTGVTHFLDRFNPLLFGNNGYSTNAWRTVLADVQAASAGGGDFLLVRPANYDESLTIPKPMTLRAPRSGWATIGSP
jgi:hypothetical protein